MRADHDAKRKRDRLRARKWLAEDHDRLALALQSVFKKNETEGDLARLRKLLPDQLRLVQGLAGLLVGEGYARPVQAGQGRYDAQGKMTLGRVIITRKTREQLRWPHPAAAEPSRQRG